MEKGAVGTGEAGHRMSTRRAAFTAGVAFVVLALATCVLGLAILSAGASGARRAA